MHAARDIVRGLTVKLYCILGMHRSGTSVVSRTLSLLGAHIGPEEDVMAPAPDNPTGFWESRKLMALHDDALGHLGGRWDAPAFMEDGWEQRSDLAPFRDRISRIIESHYATADVAYWKDPRGSLLLPLWHEVTTISGTILVVRDPAEVAESLRLRNGLGRERAAWLWLKYMSSAVRSDSGHLLVCHSDLYARPHWVASRIAAFCELPPPSDDTFHSIDTFIDPKLRHFGAASDERDVATPFADLLYDRFRTVAELESFRDRAAKLLSELTPPISDPNEFGGAS
jgi:hypothetical protein